MRSKSQCQPTCAETDPTTRLQRVQTHLAATRTPSLGRPHRNRRAGLGLVRASVYRLVSVGVVEPNTLSGWGWGGGLGPDPKHTEFHQSPDRDSPNFPVSSRIHGIKTAIPEQDEADLRTPSPSRQNIRFDDALGSSADGDMSVDRSPDGAEARSPISVRSAKRRSTASQMSLDSMKAGRGISLGASRFLLMPRCCVWCFIHPG